MTDEQLKYIVPASTIEDRTDYLKEFNDVAEKYIKGYLPICSFVAQTAYESGCFHYLKEIASGAEYEGRKDLGNTFKGDGIRFKGRGYIQLTGRANYESFKKWLGGQPDVVANPQMIEKPHLAMLATVFFWTSHHLNELSETDDFKAVTRKINGGLNGYTSRLAYYIKAKKILNIE